MLKKYIHIIRLCKPDLPEEILGTPKKSLLLKANTIFLTIFIACEMSLCFLKIDKLHGLVVHPKGAGQGEGHREHEGLGEEEGEQGGDQGRPGGVVVGDVQLEEEVQPLCVRPRPVEICDGLGQLHAGLVSPDFKYLMT